MTRSTALTLAASFAFALIVSACAAFGELGEPRRANACYWLSNVTNQWEAWPEAETKQHCYELDSCSGGLGASGGGCYKWSSGPDGPQNRW